MESIPKRAKRQRSENWLKEDKVCTDALKLYPSKFYLKTFLISYTYPCFFFYSLDYSKKIGQGEGVNNRK